MNQQVCICLLLLFYSLLNLLVSSLLSGRRPSLLVARNGSLILETRELVRLPYLGDWVDFSNGYVLLVTRVVMCLRQVLVDTLRPLPLPGFHGTGVVNWTGCLSAAWNEQDLLHLETVTGIRNASFSSNRSVVSRQTVIVSVFRLLEVWRLTIRLFELGLLSNLRRDLDGRRRL